MKIKNILLLAFLKSVKSDARNKTVRDKDDRPYGECPCGRIGMIDHHRLGVLNKRGNSMNNDSFSAPYILRISYEWIQAQYVDGAKCAIVD